MYPSIRFRSAGAHGRLLLVEDVVDGLLDQFARARTRSRCSLMPRLAGSATVRSIMSAACAGSVPICEIGIFSTIEDRLAGLVLRPPVLVVEIVERLARHRRPVTFLAMGLVELGALVGQFLVDRRQDVVRPFRRLQARKTVLGVRLRVALDHLLHLEQLLHVHARFVQALRRIGQIELGRHAERFAGVAHHRLHDRAVILHPVEPRRVPDPRVMHRRGGAGVVFRLLQVDRKHLVADPVERVEPSVTFQDALRGDALFQVLDLLVLIENLVDLVLQRLAVVERGVRSQDALGEAVEAAGHSSASAAARRPCPASS